MRFKCSNESFYLIATKKSDQSLGRSLWFWFHHDEKSSLPLSLIRAVVVPVE